jgi:hypothetical protein
VQKGFFSKPQLGRILRKAGLNPWPKLFQNLRSTRETELADIYPIHVVCAWIGNSALVAKKNYLQVTDDHFDWACKNLKPEPKKIHTEQNDLNHEELARMLKSVSPDARAQFLRNLADEFEKNKQ